MTNSNKKNTAVTVVPGTNNALASRRLVKVLQMMADANPQCSDEGVLLASMYPNVPNITYGQVREAMEDIAAMEHAIKKAENQARNGK